MELTLLLAVLDSLHLNMNPHLKNLDDDFLYHLGYSKSDDLKKLFGDVKASAFCDLNCVRTYDRCSSLADQLPLRPGKRVSTHKIMLYLRSSIILQPCNQECTYYMVV